MGDFEIENGRVTHTEMPVYDSQAPPKGSAGPIGLAEALYWILHDHAAMLKNFIASMQAGMKNGKA